MGLQRSEILTIAISITTTGLICGLMAINYYGNKLPNLNELNNAIETQHINYTEFQMEGQAKLDSISQKIVESFPQGIACWGDDLTAGVGSNDTDYPTILRKLLKENIYLDDTSNICPSVENFGISGESSITVLGRSGAIPYMNTNILDIPKDTTPIKINLLSTRFNYVKPLLKGDAGLEYVTIGGIKGYITQEDDVYYFTRAEEGEPITISAGTEIIPSGYENTQNYMPIISIGMNSGYNSFHDLVSQCEKAVKSYNTDKYLVLGLTTGTKESQLELEQEMQSRFGSNFINLREYLSSEQALKDADIQPTQKDLNALELGAIPPSLLSDSVHLNSIGYELVAKCIYNRMIDLNYFTDITKYVEEYLKIKQEYKL